MQKSKKIAIIIGAGPAGLTAAYELLKRTDIQPIIFEQDDQVGGLSRTVNYKGNRIDIGGHRFFSKLDKITNWWLNILPLKDDLSNNDNIMLVRSRLSRILFLRKFFNYPISLSFQTLSNLGMKRTIKIGFSYLGARFFPIKKEKSLQDFFINRFGKQLYNTFFKDYTKKVWGISCDKIDAEWGAQRVKGVSISKALLHAAKSLISKDKSLDQKNTETSLIDRFMYPKFGPGQMWEQVASKIKDMGGEIYLSHKIVGIKKNNDQISFVIIEDQNSKKNFKLDTDYLFSTMPVKDLIHSFAQDVPVSVKDVAKGLIYRDFITVGFLLKKLKVSSINDNWIYIQERDVKVGRIQIFNNWSPYMVKDQDNIWIGLEYFCNQGDELWNKPDDKFIDMAIDELCKIGFIDKENVIDSVVIRMPKTYPAYFGTYNKFETIRNYVNKIENLFLIGRNGMHRYNNMDHSMLTAMTAVDNIVNGIKTKNNIWSVNIEKEYHEEKSL